VDNFITNCVDEYSEAFIRDVDCVTGYSAAYTGLGCIGFYKLETKFDHAMKFVTKLIMNQYLQPTSAAFLDSALDYFIKINEDNLKY